MPGTTRNVSWGRTVHKQGRDGGRETETEELRLRPRLRPKPSDPRAGTAPLSAPPQPPGTSRWHPRTVGHPCLAPLSERSPKAWAPSAWCTVCPRHQMLLTNPGNGSTGPRAYGQALGTDGRCLGPDRRLRLPQAVVTRHLLSAAFRSSPTTSRSLSRPPAPRQHVPSLPAAVRSPPQHSAQTDGCPSSCVACPPPPRRAHAQSARRAGAGAPSSAAASECR